MTSRQTILIVTFVMCIALALLVHNEPLLGLTIGTFLSLGWHFRGG